MIRGGLLLLALALMPAPAPAQDRPPTPTEAEVRPPDRPVQGPPAPAATPEPARAPAPEVFGPPPPPRWFTLRETDRGYAACTRALRAMGTVFAEAAPITDPEDRDCGIARPLHVAQILPGVALEGGALMRCETAHALAQWAQGFLRPAAARLAGAPRITGLTLGTTYDCRPRVGTGADQPKLSEHALGNAIDIAAVQFEGAEPLVIEPRRDTGDLAEAVQATLRAAGCLYFTTVLGPGADAAHDDHLHLDIAARNGGWRLCQ